MTRFKAGDTAYIVENNRKIREVTIMRCSGGIYLIKFDNGGGIQVKEHRLFASQEEAEATLPDSREQKKSGFQSPYNYDH